jgi:hypothetical protein
MGHDTYLCAVKEVAYMRKNAFNPQNGRIYEVLKCQQFNGGVSGRGHIHLLEKEDILEALELARELKYKEEEEFLMRAMGSMKDETKYFLLKFY